MINTKEVIKTVNSIISKNKKKYFNSVISHNQLKPNYNNGLNQILVCSLKLNTCVEFYGKMSDKKLCERKCPFGFLVCKKSFDTSSNYENISIFSIISYSYNKNANTHLVNLPRNLKKKREDIVFELENLIINEDKHRKNKEYIEGLLETLLIGRIGLTIQSISHQFFTPLQGAMSDVKNLETNIDVDESLIRLSKNFSSLNKLATEIQLILSTSQEFNTNMLRRVTVHSMVDEIFNSLEGSANEKRIKLVQHFNSYSKTVHAIPTQMYIVLTNIIQNAIKYSYKGIKHIELEVSVSYKSTEDNFLVIKIENQGCQITKEEIQEKLLFNLSYRGVYSIDGQRTGSGSGLYVSSEIMKAHGGNIKVSSKFCGGDINQETDRYHNIFEVYWPIIIDD